MGAIFVFVLFVIGVIVFDFVSSTKKVELNSVTLIRAIYFFVSFMVIMFIITSVGG